MSLQQTDVAKKPRFDIEITTHCNAHCTFCPREDVPFLNHMPLATVDRVIDRIRALQSPVAVTLCGTGDCSTHPQLDEIVSRFASAFDDFSIVTNGARLHRERAAHLLDCGLKKIVFSVTEHGSRYNDIYGLPFQKTLQNITDFKELAGGALRDCYLFDVKIFSGSRRQIPESLLARPGVPEFFRHEIHQ